MNESGNMVRLCGDDYSVDEILLRCESKLRDGDTENWEKEIFAFIKDWYSESKEIIVHTSGSTGQPKKIALRKEHMVFSANSTITFFELKKGDRIWLNLPVNYIAGKMQIVRALVGNLDLWYSAPDIFPDESLLRKTDFAAMVPNQVIKILEKRNGNKLLGNIRNLLIGGSAISSDLVNKIRKYPEIVAWHSYGMTETITHIALSDLKNDRYMGEFYPLEGIKVSLGKNDRLVIDYPGINIRDLITNDIAKIWDDGSFTIIGRYDDVIISGGTKYYPERIELKIKHMFPVDIFIGALYDNILGQRITLFMESETECLTLAQLKELLADVCEKYEIPRSIVFLNKFERTESGKIKRNETVSNYLGKITGEN